MTDTIKRKVEELRARHQEVLEGLSDEQKVAVRRELKIEGTAVTMSEKIGSIPNAKEARRRAIEFVFEDIASSSGKPEGEARS